MKVVVLGANSFSGQDFVDLLLDDPQYDVIGVSRSARAVATVPEVQARGRTCRAIATMRLDMNRDTGDLLALLDREKPEAIVNFAAQSEVAPSWDHPEHWFQTNTVALRDDS